jgi:hypothetical protein
MNGLTQIEVIRQSDDWQLVGLTTRDGSRSRHRAGRDSRGTGSRIDSRCPGRTPADMAIQGPSRDAGLA